jgi:hypothetical protein
LAAAAADFGPAENPPKNKFGRPKIRRKKIFGGRRIFFRRIRR